MSTLADVIIAHQRIPLFDGSGGQRCVGCDTLYGEPDGPNSPRHAAHVADQVRAHLQSDEVIEQAAREVARANYWNPDEWRDWTDTTRAALAAALNTNQPTNGETP